MMKRAMLFLLISSMGVVSFAIKANTVTITNEYRKPIIIRFNDKDFKIMTDGSQTVGFIQDMKVLGLKTELAAQFTSLAKEVQEIRTGQASRPSARVAIIIPDTNNIINWKPARIVWESNLSLQELGNAIQGIKMVMIYVQNQETPNIIRQDGPGKVSAILYNLKDILGATGAMDVSKIPGIIGNSRPPVHLPAKTAAIVILQEALNKLQTLFVAKGGRLEQLDQR